MTSLAGNSAGDGRGHGTFVAGLAAGSASGHAGAAPTAGIVSIDLKVPFDPREVLARVVDGSRFEDYKPLYGPSLVTGWASIHGWVTMISTSAWSRM